MDGRLVPGRLAAPVVRAWKFDTALQSQDTAIACWQDVLGRLPLPSSNITEPVERFFGRVSCLVSPLGIEPSRLTGRAQEIAGPGIGSPS